MERKLATIRKISALYPIEGADLIETAQIDGWTVVVKRGEFKVGDLCVYVEIDSILPEREEFEFLRSKKFRIKTIRLKGQLSQGIAFPMNILWHFLSPEAIQELNKPLDMDYWIDKLSDGEYVTELIGIIKYEPPIPAQLAGVVKGNFPYQVPKTDEERIQNLTQQLEEYDEMNIEFVGTEKLDGTSMTCSLIDDEFHISSRNLDLQINYENTYCRVAEDTLVEPMMRAFAEKKGIKNFAIQGELIGEGIQGNKYKIKGQELRLFKIFNIDAQMYFDWDEFKEFIWFSSIKQCPIVTESFYLAEAMEEMADDKIKTFTDMVLEFVKGKSLLNPETECEGIVFHSKYNLQHAKRASFGAISFKGINNDFLLKHKE